MTPLTEATDVFAAAEASGRCVVAFLCKRQPAPADQASAACFPPTTKERSAR